MFHHHIRGHHRISESSVRKQAASSSEDKPRGHDAASTCVATLCTNYGHPGIFVGLKKSTNTKTQILNLLTNGTA